MSTAPRSDATEDDDAGATAAAAAVCAPDDGDEQQRQQQQSALHPNEEEGASTLPSQPDSNAASTLASTSTSNSNSNEIDSQALTALLRALPPSQILYLSLPSTAPLPGPSPHISLLSRTVSHARDTQNQNQGEEEEGREAEAGEYLVRGGAVGEWAAARGERCDWDEVDELGILPSREDLDRFAAAAAEVAEEEE
ncbi:hypothetical protein RHOSPDRAFT_37191 [Rhodotorula sp. JG-1b]|nr:hypothetical protein RHOSPDRAFT_37191 [Rhodotorula sp. JG-1b]